MTPDAAAFDPSRLVYGLTGNVGKEALWEPLAALVGAMDARGQAFRLHGDLAAGLVERQLMDAERAGRLAADDLPGASTLLLSFGGDGTFLRTAHLADGHDTPILGVNIGRLGFLATVEVGGLADALAVIEAGEARVEPRMTLGVRIDDGTGLDRPDGVPAWALNDVVVDKSGTTSMIQIETHLDGRFLNTYWADGLVVATPTGSTAYALSVGGPIVTPGTDGVVVAPIAPHTLTARPVVLPSDAELTLRVVTRGEPVAFACDGVSTLLPPDGPTIHVRQSRHCVRLVTLPGRDFFTTVRDKLSWGRGGVF